MPQSSQLLPPLRIGLVLFPDCMPAGLFAVADIARAANVAAGREVFRTTWVGTRLGPVATWQGPTLTPQATIHGADCDLLLVPGLWLASTNELAAKLVEHRDLVRALRASPPEMTLWSYCAGVVLLAAAQRLDGKSATATWWLRGSLEERHPRVRWRFDEPLAKDEGIATAAGAHGYLPLMLDLLDQQLSGDVRRSVEEALMLPNPRARHEVFDEVDPMTLRDPELRRWLVIAQRTPAAELTLERAAARAKVSVRTMCRRVQAALHLPAGEWFRRIKLRQVADALVLTADPLKTIGANVGFASEATLHRAFRRTTGCTPATYRQRYARPR